ncbi:MAG: hypothetical protein ACC612_05895 [Methanomethylovorans sp.]|uniref:hypothetical protein n=1 Tax=Methanomethylovorans sp. TaxID=2758717 RepID=UPI0035307E13
MNCNRILNKKVMLAFFITVVISATLVSAWSTYVVFNDNTYVTSAHLTGKTSYSVIMDVDGASGLVSNHQMITTVYEDVPLAPDKVIRTWTTRSDYNAAINSLSSSKTYYTVWDMTGTGGVQYGTLSFV